MIIWLDFDIARLGNIARLEKSGRWCTPPSFASGRPPSGQDKKCQHRFINISLNLFQHRRHHFHHKYHQSPLKLLLPHMINNSLTCLRYVVCCSYSYSSLITEEWTSPSLWHYPHHHYFRHLSNNLSHRNLDCIEKEISPGEHGGNDAVLKRSPAGSATPLILLALLLHPANEHLMVILRV